MQPIRSILVAVERERDSTGALNCAVMLARRFGARVDLFLCEAERAYALHHQYDPGSTNIIRDAFLTESRARIERQWKALDVNDVSVSIDVVCDSPQYDAIKRKVEQSGPGLVIRGIGGRECAFSVVDSDVLQTCPAPLLLTRGKLWRHKPVVAAAIDISGVEPPSLTRAILNAAADIAERCGAELQVLYAQRLGTPTAEESRARLTACVATANVNSSQLHVIIGEPATVIPQFAAAQGYEMLVLGALTHRKSVTALVGTLTGRLVETVDCDLLLVKPA